MAVLRPFFFFENLLAAGVARGTPLLLSSVGEVIAERAGVMNLGVDGMMLLGAAAGFGAAHASSSALVGLLVAMAAASLLSLVHAVVSVTLSSDQVVSGLGLNFFGTGLSSVIGARFVGKAGPTLPTFQIAGLSAIPLVGPCLFAQNIVIHVGMAVMGLAWFYLYRTGFGLTLRAVGESPSAADGQGISVARVRFLHVGLGGALAGLAGAHLSLATGSAWIEGMVAGRGWIVVALTIFAGWDARRAVACAFLFGGLDVLQFFAPEGVVPPHALKTLPYVATLAALALGRRREAPAALGIPYEPGKR